MSAGKNILKEYKWNYRFDFSYSFSRKIHTDELNSHWNKLLAIKQNVNSAPLIRYACWTLEYSKDKNVPHIHSAIYCGRQIETDLYNEVITCDNAHIYIISKLLIDTLYSLTYEHERKDGSIETKHYFSGRETNIGSDLDLYVKELLHFNLHNDIQTLKHFDRKQYPTLFKYLGYQYRNGKLYDMIHIQPFTYQKDFFGYTEKDAHVLDYDWSIEQKNTSKRYSLRKR